MEISAIDRSVIVARSRNVKVGDLLTALVTDYVAKAAVVHTLRPVFRIPDNLVYEIAQVENKPERLGGLGSLIFIDHSAKGALRSLIHILAAHDANFSDRGSLSLGAVIVLPTRLPEPCLSEKRYQ